MRTKIICTIGPGSLNKDTLLSLLQAGLGVARLNGSHADLQWHSSAIRQLRSAMPHIPILLDVPGRKIRTLQLLHEPSFRAGDSIVLTSDSMHDGTEKVPVSYQNLHLDLSVGDVIMADDGVLMFVVIAIDGKDIICRAEVDGQLKSRKGINVPMVKFNLPMVSERDIQMIEFACEHDIDFIGLSFVETGEQVEAFRKIINGRGPQIVSKIENQGGLLNLNEIISHSDAIMIDRGDLSVETGLFQMGINQKTIIQEANKYGCPVIVATEMLHSMIDNAQPTKAEIADITNAVLDGCSATMLSGETAVGKYPKNAVDAMKGTILAAEKYMYEKSNDSVETSKLDNNYVNALCGTIERLCKDLPLSKVIVLTRTGHAAKVVARGIFPQNIIAVSDDPKYVRTLNLIRGVVGVQSNFCFDSKNGDYEIKILNQLWLDGMIEESDEILLLGVSYPVIGSKVNSLKILSVASLIMKYGWEKP